MSLQIKSLSRFDRQAKRLLKKYRSLNRDIATLVGSLETDPTQGASLGQNCYKIRLSIASKGQGKRGGARVITCVIAVTTEVYLLTIYDKADQESVTDAELQALIDEIPTR